MCSRDTLVQITGQVNKGMQALLGNSMKEVILFGSYARNDADTGSDIDIMVLCDMSRSDIAKLNWQIGEIASAILLEYGVLVSPIIENRAYFMDNTEIMPFFRNIRDEGVRISA